MAEKTGRQTSWIGGFSDSDKAGGENTYVFGRNINHRSDPRKITVNPRAENDTGTLINGLPIWGARACNRLFFYTDTGKVYKKESGAYSLVHSASDSSGNGMAYFPEDRNLYYAQNTTIGRLFEACTGEMWTDDFLSSEGGDPTNTKSLSLNGTTQYAYVDDNAHTSITDDISMEAFYKPSALPATGEEQVLMGKWDENTNQRSYRMYISTISNFFGNGSDGALTISTNTTDAPIDSACSGTAGAYTLTATNANFAAGQKVMIHQTRGNNAGVYQINTISSYTAGTITLEEALDISYNSTGNNKAQVLVLKQYTNVTVNAGITWTAKAWNGTVGGILAFLASGTLTNNGTINLSGNGSQPNTGTTVLGGTGGGFRGGSGISQSEVGAAQAYTGESQIGPSLAQQQRNGGGGGGGDLNNLTGQLAGGGGSYGTASSDGAMGSDAPSRGNFGQQGSIYGSANLSTIDLGSGGGGGAKDQDSNKKQGGASGGGAGLLLASVFTNNGIITANGGSNPSSQNTGHGGGGAGGSILIKCQTATIGTITATGGRGGYDIPSPAYNQGGTGGDGRISLYYSTSYTGTTTPALTAISDPTLASADGYALKLQISNDGSTYDTFTWDITENLSTSLWKRWQVSWDAPTSTANAYVGGFPLGTKTGTKTAIYDSTAKFAIGCDFDSSAQNFAVGLIDQVRLWNDVRTETEFRTLNEQILTGNEFNLIAYYQFNDDVTDSQASGNNDLTAVASPTYSTDIPFYGITTRNDEDQSNSAGTGDTTALATSISEAATALQTFSPKKDPQKSIQVYVSAKGTGDWTLTVHDAQNREVASKTLDNNSLTTGTYAEFIFDSVWRPLSGYVYHFHITSTVADGTVRSSTTNDLETSEFYSYYQTLVNEPYHPMLQMLNFLAIGNGRYVATLEAGSLYFPNKITLPSGYHVRSLGYWREYLAIGTYQGENLSDYQEGKIFFWDGISDTYNFYISVPEGGVNAMFGTRDLLFVSAGSKGEILVYTGQGNAEKLEQIPRVETGEEIEVSPGAVNMYNTLICFGIAIESDSSNLYKGLYTYGTLNKNYPYSLGFDYETSLGEQVSNNVKIGMVYPSGGDLYIGWSNSNAFGIDKIDMDNDQYATASIEQLIVDADKISKDKVNLIVRADFSALESGQEIRVKYKLDRDDAWIYSDWEDTEGAEELRLRIHNPSKEIQIGADLSSTISTQVELYGLSVQLEDGDQREI